MAILTICRESGVGGEEVGMAVAEKLGYEYVAKDAILKEIGEHGEKWLKWSKELDDHKPSLWERFDQSFAGYIALMESIMLQHAVKNNVVLMGRGGNWLLNEVPHALRVRIVASENSRVDRVLKTEAVDSETARKMIAESDKERSAYLKAVYHKNWTKPEYYDVVFDADNMGVEEITNMILDEIAAKDGKFQAAAGEKLAQVALAAAVKAGIHTQLKSYIPTLEVEHDGEQIVLKGTVHSAIEQKEALSIAEGTAAPTTVNNKLHYRGA
jgi:cytidylate kinase